MAHGQAAVIVEMMNDSVDAGVPFAKRRILRDGIRMFEKLIEAAQGDGDPTEVLRDIADYVRKCPVIKGAG